MGFCNVPTLSAIVFLTKEEGEDEMERDGPPSINVLERSRISLGWGLRPPKTQEGNWPLEGCRWPSGGHWWWKHVRWTWAW